MKFKLEIKMNNSAFGETDEDRGAEVAMILRDLAKHFSNGGIHERSLMDTNGNTVGKATIERTR